MWISCQSLQVVCAHCTSFILVREAFCMAGRHIKESRAGNIGWEMAETVALQWH